MSGAALMRAHGGCCCCCWGGRLVWAAARLTGRRLPRSLLLTRTRSPHAPPPFPQRTSTADQRQGEQHRKQQLAAAKAELQQQGADEEPRKV